MKTFVINLDRRPDRLNAITKQLDNLELKYTRVSATDGNALKDSDCTFVDKEKFVARNKHLPKAGEIGCALSHMKIWNQIIDENIPVALILEDDVTINSDLVEFISDPLNYERYGLINLAESYLNDSQENKAILNSILKVKSSVSRPLFMSSSLGRKWSAISDNGKSFCTITKHNSFIVCECDKAPARTMGYIISRETAASFLRETNSLFVAIDKVQRYSSGFHRHAFLAMPIVSEAVGPLDTDIQQSDKRIKLSLRRKLLRFYLKRHRFKRKLSYLILRVIN